MSVPLVEQSALRAGGVVQAEPLPPPLRALELTQALQHCRIDGQGLQERRNSIPLIAGKQLFVRVYVSPKAVWPANVAIDARVRVVADGQEVGDFVTAAPVPPGRLVPGRASGAALDVAVDAEVCRGDVGMIVEVLEVAPAGDARVVVEHELAVRFLDVPEVPVHLVVLPLRVMDWNKDGKQRKKLAAAKAEDLDGFLAGLEARVPVPRLVRTAGTTRLAEFRAYESKQLDDVYWYVVWTDLATTLPYVTAAAISKHWKGGTVGNGGAGVLVAPVDRPEVAGHELGHVLGRDWHAPCTGNDPGYGFPRYPGLEHGRIGEWGFRSMGPATDTALSALDPAGFWDDMTVAACKPKWASPYGYRRSLRGALDTSWRNRKRVTQRILAQLVIDGLNHAQIVQWHRLAVAPREPYGELTRFTVELRDRCGPLAAQRLRLLDACVRPIPGRAEDHLPLSFIVDIPWDDRATSLVVRLGRHVVEQFPLAASAPSLDPPTAVLLSGTTWRVSWAGTGTSHIVRYTADGGANWIPVAVNMSAMSLDVDLAGLPGGGRCAFEVTASRNGRSATQRTSEFSRPLAPVAATIARPAGTSGMASLVEGGFVEFLGTAFSPDRAVRPGDVVWTVTDAASTTTRLGAGPRLIVPVRRIPRGISTVRMEHQPDGARAEITVSRPTSSGGSRARGPV